MVDTSQKRNRNRKQIEKRQLKEARRRDRADAKLQRGFAPEPSAALDGLDSEQPAATPRSEGNKT